MAKKFINLLAGMAIMECAATLFAAPASTAKAVEGTLMLEDKNNTLSHALAYETTVNGEEAIAVVLSGQAISSEDLKKSKEEEKRGGFASFKRPFLILNFTKAGQLKFWGAAAGGTSIGRAEAGKATAELRLQDGKVSGKASKPRDAEAKFPTAFDVRFDVKLLAAAESLPATVVKKPGPAANVQPTVTGVFKGNGKEAKLAYVSARWGEPFSGKQGLVLVFSEKDHSKVKKPDFDAAFGKFGSALIISLHEDGGIYGCQVVHSAHSKQGFSSIGSIRTNNFKYEEGKVEGELVTDGQLEFFGDTWEVNLKFLAPLGEIPKEFQVPDSKKPEEKAIDKPAATKPTARSTTATPVEKPETQPAEDQFKIKDLALTKDATDLDYKTPLKQLLFKTKSDVKGASAELAANLTAQGWTNDGKDIFNAQSAILRWKRGNSRLTVFVKPEKEGSLVTMFTKGFSWEGL